MLGAMADLKYRLREEFPKEIALFVQRSLLYCCLPTNSLESNYLPFHLAIHQLFRFRVTTSYIPRPFTTS